MMAFEYSNSVGVDPVNHEYSIKDISKADFIDRILMHMFVCCNNQN